MKLYENRYSNPAHSAQQDLIGRTHYVDPDTLRHHHSRILAYNTHYSGLLASVIESCSLDMRNTKRGFRHVVFDVFGTVISRANLDDCVTSKKAAIKALYAFLDGFDAKAHTLKAIEDQRARREYELQDFITQVEAL